VVESGRALPGEGRRLAEIEREVEAAKAALRQGGTVADFERWAVASGGSRLSAVVLAVAVIVLLAVLLSR
jgi:hypothetical protein